MLNFFSMCIFSNLPFDDFKFSFKSHFFFFFFMDVYILPAIFSKICNTIFMKMLILAKHYICFLPVVVYTPEFSGI